MYYIVPYCNIGYHIIVRGIICPFARLFYCSRSVVLYFVIFHYVVFVLPCDIVVDIMLCSVILHYVILQLYDMKACFVLLVSDYIICTALLYVILMS